VRVVLNEAQLRESTEVARVIGETRTLEAPNPTGLEAPGRYEKGDRGETGFELLLLEQRVRYERERRTDGKADEFDFKVWVMGTPKTIDVKAAGEPHHRRCMIPDAQFQRRKRDVYVGGRLELPYVNFLGWASRAEVADWPVEPKGFSVKGPTPTRWWWLACMNAMPDLFRWLDKVK
jgi:hypothetical protein